MRKKRILISIDWFEPAYKAGGPIRSIKNMVELLSKDFDFHILTSDRDSGDIAPFPDIPLDVWIERENYSIFYLSEGKQKYHEIKRLLTEQEYDHFYFNSLFSVKFSLLPLLILKFLNKDHKAVLAPRGMLGKAALDIKPLKKRVFLSLSRALGLFGKITWHASTALEEKEIKTALGKASKVHIAQNIAQKPRELPSLEKGGEVGFIFLSRISSKKNLVSAISYFDQLDFGSKKVFFHIYGPIEDEVYWKKCKDQIQKTESSAKIEYKGSLDREEVNPALEKYHFMLFPTKNENFGHNIAEALLCGLPVILSDQTPWRNLNDKKAGWDIPLNNDQAFRNAIKEAVDMGNEEYQEWRKSAREFAEKKLFSEEVYKKNKELLNKK